MDMCGVELSVMIYIPALVVDLVILSVLRRLHLHHQILFHRDLCVRIVFCDGDGLRHSWQSWSILHAIRMRATNILLNGVICAYLHPLLKKVMLSTFVQHPFVWRLQYTYQVCLSSKLELLIGTRSFASLRTLVFIETTRIESKGI